MKLLRISALSLIPVFLAPLLLSCSSAKTGGAEASDTAEASSEETTMSPNEDNLPEFDYDGYEFRVLTFPNNGGEHTDLTFEEQNGEVLNDAVYTVSREVEDRFNIRFKETKDAFIWSAAPDNLKKIVLAGEDAYDLDLQIDREAMRLAMEDKYFYYMDELPYVDLTKAYWYPDMNKAISINNKLYFAYSAYNIEIYDYLCFMVFNKDIARDYNIGNIYELIKEGKWTIDAMQSMCKLVTSDLDGDGKFTDSDQYGFVGVSYYMYSDFYEVEQIPIIAKDENDLPFFNVPGNERLFAIFDKVHECANSGYWFDLAKKTLKKFASTGLPTAHEIAMRMFSDNFALFGSSSVYMVQALRSMESDYGIIPYPAYEEKDPGDPYYARVPTSMVMVVPSVNPNPERCSVIMEALASEYYKTVVPAYFDVVTQQKAVRDEESWDVLNMLDGHRFMDMGDTVFLSMGIGRSEYEGLFSVKANNFASQTAKLQPKADKVLGDVIENFKAVEAKQE